MMLVAETMRERRLERAADRQGLCVQKLKGRDPCVVGYGLYRIIDAPPAGEVTDGAAAQYSMSLDEVDVYLTGKLRPAQATLVTTDFEPRPRGRVTLVPKPAPARRATRRSL